jgi:hypothetical protein
VSPNCLVAMIVILIPELKLAGRTLMQARISLSELDIMITIMRVHFKFYCGIIATLICLIQSAVKTKKEKGNLTYVSLLLTFDVDRMIILRSEAEKIQVRMLVLKLNVIWLLICVQYVIPSRRKRRG